MKTILVLLSLNIQGIFGRSFLPLSLVKEFTNKSKHRQEQEQRRAQVCPSVLGLQCDPPPLDPNQWQACFEACTAAACCQDQCQQECVTSCLSYAPCLGLGTGPPDPAEPSDSTCNILSVDYFQGYNLHFQIEESQAKTRMPSSWFSPMKLNILNGQRQRIPNSRNRNGSGGYFLSFYVATIAVDIGEMQVRTGRADLFTYAIDPEGEPSLVILAAFVEVPQVFQNNPDLLIAYKSTIEGLSTNAITGEVAYPHHYAFDFRVQDDGFVISSMEGMPEETIEIKINEGRKGRAESFSTDFVLGWFGHLFFGSYLVFASV